MSSFVRFSCLSALVLASIAACGSDRPTAAEPTALVPSEDAAAPSPACAGRRCSRDLHAILDGCSGDVIEECPPNQGCAAGQCAAPCEAASKAEGSIGCSFWTAPPDTHVRSETSCFAAFVANTWSTPATVRAGLKDSPLDVSKSIYRAIPEGATLRYERLEGPIPPGEVGIVFLSQGTPQPHNIDAIVCPPNVEVAYHGTVGGTNVTGIDEAFNIETDVPVSAYSIFPYGGAKSYTPAATMLLPTTSWSTNYLLVDGYESVTGALGFIQVVAQKDNTIVRIRPRVDIRGGEGVAGGAAGEVTSWTLGRGQVLKLAQLQSLAGSPLESTEPVSVFGGTACAGIPQNSEACDTLHQQIAPLAQWGNSYAAVPYKSRRRGLNDTSIAESVVYRIGAARDGTQLAYEPERPPGAPLALATGELVFFESDRPFLVRSQGPNFPIYLATYMTSAQRYRPTVDGDPDFVNVIATAQFLDRYVFFVDYTYANSTLTVVRHKDGKGFHDVRVDCAGTVDGWQPLGADGELEYTWIDVTKSGDPVVTAGGTCSYGRHEASSDGPFGLYVWGTDSYASYGYPAGAGTRQLSDYSILVR